MHILNYLCLGVYLISQAYSKIFVRSPKTLTKLLPREGSIKGSFSNFGNIPYGYNLVGHLLFDTNSTEPVLACGEPLNNLNLDSLSIVDESPIVMIDRGNCTFTKKVQNVENAGGHIALIVNNEDSNPEHTIMSDDGNGKSITIPAVLISKNDGQILKDFNRAHPEKRIVLEIDFEMVNTYLYLL
jgi:hypothetical protein